MAIKGFVGYWGNISNRLISDSFCNLYKDKITNSVSLYGVNWGLTTTKDFVKKNDENSLEISSNPDDHDFNINSKVIITKSLLSLERDRWGIRTIYYVKFKSGYYFSSDIRFLLILPIDHIKDYSTSSIQEISSLGFIFNEENTLFSLIKQVPRNSCFEVSENKSEIEKHTVSSNKTLYKSVDEAYKKFKNIFEDTVHNINSLPGKKAYLLSGGMDSSALAIAASKFSSIETISFSSANNENDVFYAEKLSQYLGSKHTVVQFDENEGLLKLPNYFHDIEQIEPEGVFSPLGGYAYYLLCQSINKLNYSIVIPGEGADELLGGYYWPLTHPFGFVDKLKKITQHSEIYSQVVGMFPEVEEKNIYSEIAYYFLQGSALTNYHLSCVEHTAKSCNLVNYPVFLTGNLHEIIKNIPLKWLCDGTTTKIILRKYLHKYLDNVCLSGLIDRPKMAMPSVITNEFSKKIFDLSKLESQKSNNPYREELQNNPVNILMFDLFHKYYTSQPINSVLTEEWKEDLSKINRNERIIYW